VICGALFLSLGGCAGPMNAIDLEKKEEMLPADYFSSQQKCFDAWQEIVDEWTFNGGKILGTLDETRRVLRKDDKSRLSLLFKKVWEKQSPGIPYVEPSNKEISLIFNSSVSDEVPEECGSIVWIQEVFAQADGALSSDDKNALIMVAPQSARADDRSFSRWLLYGLLKKSLN
jgi:hypothetical protein